MKTVLVVLGSVAIVLLVMIVGVPKHKDTTKCDREAGHGISLYEKRNCILQEIADNLKK